MSRRSVRIACLLAGLLATGALGYRAFQDENTLSRARRDAGATDLAAEQALQSILDLRASLHAYVAPGQGTPFWAGRSQEALDTLRQRLVTLDAAVAPLGTSLSEALDAVDQLAAAEQRARNYAIRGDSLLAGDVVFGEAGDLLSATITHVQTARNVARNDSDRRASALREEQAALAGGAVAVWLVIALLLAPTAAVKEPVKDPADWRHELSDALKKPVPAPVPSVEPNPVEPVAPLEPLEPTLSVRAMREMAEICTDLSALSDPGALSGALARVSDLLNANGLIVWVASNDGSTLSPVATHGFDPKLVARIGRIARDSANLTAAAFRENAPKVSAATITAPAALALALCGPSGPSGVLSIELRNGEVADGGCVALASIIAAQLATLAMPIPMTPPVAAEQQRAAL